MLDTDHCANCGRAIAVPAQKFCPDCGQPTPAHRIDWHFLGHELEHSVLHMDRGILYTLRNLMLRPGHLMRDYLEGRRAHHVKPLLLIMMLAAAVVLATRLLLNAGVMDGAMAIGMGDALKQSNPRPEWMMEVDRTTASWMNHHFAVYTLLLLPFEALTFKLAFRRFGHLNYPEWLVIAAFLTAQTFVIWGLSIPFQRAFPRATTIALVVAVIWNVFSLVQLFKGYPRWKSALRALLGFALFGVVSSVLSFVAAAAYVIATRV